MFFSTANLPAAHVHYEKNLPVSHFLKYFKKLNFIPSFP